VIAIGCVAVALGIQHWLAPWLNGHFAFTLLVVAIVLSAWWCGFGPALLATALGAAAAFWLFPTFHEKPAPDAPERWGALAVYVGLCLAISWHSLRARRAQARLEAEAARLADQSQTLAGRIKELEQAQAKWSAYTRELETMLDRRTTELQESNRTLVDICHAIAHDFRAPLRATHSFSTLLLDSHSAKLDEKGCEFAQRIATASLRMDRLIGDLLAYGQAASFSPSLNPVHTDHLVRHVVESLRNARLPPGARLEVAYPLPPVQADPMLLTQALTCLIENALKFVAPGVAPRVQVRAELNQGWVRLVVQDNGIGIPPEFHDQIFHTFTQLAPQRYEGTGMGLAIVKKAVERMGGRFGLQSAPAQGSCFWIELPPARSASSL
jgi:signal transduction histidine kinase